MNWVEKINFYYKEGLWGEERVRAVVGKVITPEEYEEIIGESYVLKEPVDETAEEELPTE